MTNTFYQKDLLSLEKLEPEDFLFVLDTAARFKQEWKTGVLPKYLEGKQIAVILQKESLRTRISLESGIGRLGGQCLLMTGKEAAFSRGEPVVDTAKVLDGYVDAIVLRTFADTLIEELAEHAEVPVLNALTDLHHPFQGFADMLAIKEHFGSFKGLKMTYLGDGSNNMAHTYLLAGALCGVDTVISSPASYQPNIKIYERAQEIAQLTGTSLTLEPNPNEAAKSANILVTDTFTSMGQEDEYDLRLNEFKAYQVCAPLFAEASPEAVFMHCLPAHRGEEVTSEVIDGPRSLIYAQAHNRLYVQQALLAVALNERL